MESTHEPVAVLGIGAMGHGMATSALRAGIRTIVWNRNPAASQDLADLGGEVAETAAEAARRAAIVVTMVSDADAVISIARDQGMLAALAPGPAKAAPRRIRQRRRGCRPRAAHRSLLWVAARWLDHRPRESCSTRTMNWVMVELQ
jgi:hypothetical protein